MSQAIKSGGESQVAANQIKSHIKFIDHIVQSWNTKYKFSTKFVEKINEMCHYETDFSLPTQGKPCPIATVKVHWMLKDRPGSKHPHCEFSFENECLKHKLTSTIRADQFESWINRVLNEKIRMRNVVNLKTNFEKTRIVDNKKRNLQSENVQQDMNVNNVLESEEDQEEVFLKENKELLLMKFKETTDLNGIISFEGFKKVMAEFIPTFLQNCITNDDITLFNQCSTLDDNNKVSDKSAYSFPEINDVDSVKEGLQVISKLLEKNYNWDQSVPQKDLINSIDPDHIHIVCTKYRNLRQNNEINIDEFVYYLFSSLGLNDEHENASNISSQ